VAVLTTIVAVVQAVSFQDVIGNGRMDQLSPFAMWSPLVIVTALLLALLGALAYVAGQVAALDALAGRPVDMKRAWRFAAQLPVVGTLLLWFVAIVVATVLCILPVLYVGPLLSFFVPVMAEEGRFGAGALSRSAELARFNPSRRLGEHPIVKILLLTLVTTLISYMAGVIVALPFQIPMFIDIFRKTMAGQEDIAGTMGRWIWLQVTAQFLSALARMAIYIYTAFGIALLYTDVRGSKEGSDLRPEIDALFPAPAAPPPVPPSAVPPSGEPWP